MRTCMFCGESSLTNEDAWPLWMMKLMPTEKVGIMMGQRGNVELQPWPSKGPRLTIKCVCAECNNGWMSQLENQVQPIIESLLSSKPALLSLQQQEILSTWSIKTSMVFEALSNDQPWFYHLEERKEFRESHKPPTQTFIWIAKCVGHESCYCSASNLKGIAEEMENLVSGYCTTMAFRELAIQVLTIRVNEYNEKKEDVIIKKKAGPWNQTAIRIWPIQKTQINWPPAIGLFGEIGLQEFIERWK